MVVYNRNYINCIDTILTLKTKKCAVSPLVVTKKKTLTNSLKI
jgi:hypothetical protein